MSAHLHLVTSPEASTPTSRAASEDPALRPTGFDDFVGQREIINNLRDAVRAAKRGGWQLDHQLFAGPAGLGKTSLAAVVATELGSVFKATSAPAIEHKGALMTMLTKLEEGAVLFIDEIHALKPEIAECLYLAMEDRVIDLPAGKQVIRVALKHFTLLGATTHPGKLAKPLRDRFGFIWQLKPYTLPEMTSIVANAARKLAVGIDEAGAAAIARAARGTPRVANRLLRRVRDAALNAATDGALVRADTGSFAGRHGCINEALALTTLARLGIDHLGLEELDRRYLALVSTRAVGIEALSAELAEDRSTLEDVVEPFLMQMGLIQRGGRGRRATEAGQQHLTSLAEQAP